MAGKPKTVCLGMPGYGGITAGAARGFYLASGPQSPLKVALKYSQGSLLAQQFNELWAWCLTNQAAGSADYFAMIHADVEPCDGWLDLLIAELENRDLDVLGVVMPIKSPHGLTSTAVGGSNRWRPKCRLTMHEVYQLPATFTAADVGGPLLINTGLWAARLGDWAKYVHFTINDRIVQGPDGRYFAEAEPEDWFVSRLFHDLGLRVGATRKIPALHVGPAHYSNREAWGEWKFDQDYATGTQLPGLAGPAGFRFPYDVDGWLSAWEGANLARLAEGRRVLEIGSYCGRSTICLAQSADEVTSIDPHDGRGTPKPRNTFYEFQANLERYGLRGKVLTLLRRRSPAELGVFDLVFIDGDHGRDAVEADIRLALEVIAADGVIVFHDYRRAAGDVDGRWDPGVTEAVDAFISAGAEMVSLCDTLAVVKPPARKILEV